MEPLHAWLARKRMLLATAIGGTGFPNAVLESYQYINDDEKPEGPAVDIRSSSVKPILVRILVALPSELLCIDRSWRDRVDPAHSYNTISM